ncbi:MAG: FAD-dependent monooxygenase, partial [Pseudomonadota bacterium]
GLREHLDYVELRKFGLSFFFGEKDAAGDLAAADELGASDTFAVPTWQVDRGRLENTLVERALAKGVTVHGGSRVTGLEMNGVKRLQVQGEAGERTLTSRWLIDATSRASLVKKHLKLQKDADHDINASWFRVEGEVRVDDWSRNAAWQARTGERARWFSTNQLMGPGYWVWIIPLSSGATSIGIVADPAYHPFKRIVSLEASLAWLAEFEPRLYAALADHPTMDFGVLRHPSHDCRRVFDPSGWALTGESGMFLDPLYSPGTDFIAIANCFIGDLIARERSGSDITARTTAHEIMFRSLFQNTLSGYQGLYGGFGNVRFMAFKTTWDYCFYWGLFGLLYTQRAMTRPADDAELRNLLLQAVAMNRRMQRRFGKLAAAGTTEPAEGRFFDQQSIPLMQRLNEDMLGNYDDAGLLDKVRSNIGTLERLSQAIVARLENTAAPVSDEERDLLGEFPALLRA